MECIYVQFEKILDSFPSVFYPTCLAKDILRFSNLWTVDFTCSGKCSTILSSNITFEVFYLLSENPMTWILECFTIFIIFLSSLL